MAAIQCPDLDELERFVLDDLDAESSTRVRLHLESCAACVERRSEVIGNLEVGAAVRRALPRRPAGPPSVPERIGAYRILRELGRGGMGVVYAAEQPAPRRTVALKILDERHAFDADYERRLAREVRALGRLRHPGIPAILEAGVTPEGRPYFTMELVEGVPIVAYARERTLTLAQKLDLLDKVCAALVYAHQKGILHRDLKPSNVLVDERGEPRVLDFGLAKIVGSEPGERSTLHTATGIVQGTFPYMSPEQVTGQETDVRSDVYSLGVLLYELLVGKLPYAADWRRLAAALWAITEAPPTRPRRVDRSLPRDLETVMLKALEKDPEQRYDTAAGLRDDLRRVRRGEPIAARPPTLGYQLGRLVSRHRAASGLAAALLLAVVASSVWLLVLYDRAEGRRVAAVRLGDEAQQSAEEARAVQAFLEDMLRAADPWERGSDVSVGAILDDAARKLDEGRFADRPRVEAALRQTVGASYRPLGRVAESEAHLRQAVSLREAQGEDEATAAARLELAMTLRIASGRAEALELLRRALATLDPAVGAPHAQAGVAWLLLADTLLDTSAPGWEAETEAALERAFELLGEAPRPEDRADAWQARSALAILRRRQGRFDDARELGERIVAHREETSGPDHPATAAALSELGATLVAQGEYRAALEVLRRVVELRGARLGGDHPDTGRAWNDAAFAARELGDLAEAEAGYRRALEILRATYGDRNVELAPVLSNLAQVLVGLGRPEEAEELARESLDLLTAASGERHESLIPTLGILGQILKQRGDLEEAERFHRRCHSIAVDVYGEVHPTSAGALNNVVAVLMARGELEEAWELQSQVLAVQRELLPPRHSSLAVVVGNLATLCSRRGDHAEAVRLYREALEILEPLLAPGHTTLGIFRLELGIALGELGEDEEAGQHLRAAVETFARDPERRSRAEARLESLLERQAGGKAEGTAAPAGSGDAGGR